MFQMSRGLQPPMGAMGPWTPGSPVNPMEPRVAPELPQTNGMPISHGPSTPLKASTLRSATSLTAPTVIFPQGTAFGPAAPRTPTYPAPATKDDVDDEDIMEDGDMDPQARMALRAEQLRPTTETMSSSNPWGPRQGCCESAVFRPPPVPVQWPDRPAAQMFASVDNPLFGKYASFGNSNGGGNHCGNSPSFNGMVNFQSGQHGSLGSNQF